jgi:hypothetical protein
MDCPRCGHALEANQSFSVRRCSRCGHESFSAYSPPLSPTAPPVHAAKPTRLLSRFVVILLAMNVLASVLAVVLSGVELVAFPGFSAKEDYTEPGEIALAAASGLAGLGTVLVLLCTVIAFCVWIHRTNFALQRIRGLTFTPGWAVGWWFVPFANLVKPYQVMVELWRASDPDGTGADWWLRPRSGVLPVWWGIWIFNGFLGNVAARLSWNAMNGEQASQTALIASIASDVVNIPAAVLCAWMVWQLQQRGEKQLASSVQ